VIGSRRSWHERLAAVCGGLAGLMLLACACLIFYEVVLRKMGQPSVWSEEVAIYLLIWATYLGLAYAESTESHIRMSLVSDHAGPRVRVGLEIVSTLVTVAFLLVLIYYGFRQALHSYELNRLSVSLLRIPMVYLQAALPVGGILILVQCLARSGGRIRAHLDSTRLGREIDA
jgi:TRAP-type C4-dicarboxylate transport system permease small subunit